MRLRRAIGALALAVIVGTVAAAAAGVVAAGEPQAGGGFPVRTPLPGDAGTYSSGHDELRFMFTTDPVVMDDGSVREALVLLQVFGEDDDVAPSENWRQVPDNHTVFWVLDGKAVASRHYVGSGDSQWPYRVNGYPELYGGFYDLYDTLYGDAVQPFCGLLHSLQGSNVDPRGTVVAPGCDPLDFAGWAGNATFPSASFERDGRSVVLDSRFPVPTTMTTSTRVWRLTAFQQGGASVAPVGLHPSVPLAYAVGGFPDETGVQHPFPLSAALQAAREASNPNALKDFEGAHPDAYLADAQGIEVLQDGRRQFQWTLTVSDGAEAAAVVVSQHGTWTELGVPEVDSPATTSLPIPAVADAAAPDRPYPTSADATRFPTLSSLAARWAVTASDESLALGMNAWGFSVVCGASCDEPRTETWAGVDVGREYMNPGDGDSELPHAYLVLQQDRLTVDDQGHSIRRIHTQWWANNPVRGVETNGRPPSAIPAATITDPPAWVRPSLEAAAGMTLVGILAGLAYYFWPTVKGALVGILRSAKPEPENAMRAEIRAAIAAAPGIHFQGLRRRTGKAAGTLRHHLRVLEERDDIIALEQGGYKCYFIARGTDRKLLATQGALKSPSARRMLAGIVSSGHLAMGQASALAGLDPSTATHHAARLANAGLVVRVRTGRSVELRPTPLAQSALAAAESYS